MEIPSEFYRASQRRLLFVMLPQVSGARAAAAASPEHGCLGRQPAQLRPGGAGQATPSCQSFTDRLNLTELHAVAARIDMCMKWFQNQPAAPHDDLKPDFAMSDKRKSS